MPHRFGRWRRTSALPVLLIAAFSLSGCFDMAYDVDLKNDGSGKIETKVIMNKEISEKFAEAQKDKNKDQDKHEDEISILSKLNAHVTTENKMKDGHFTQTETLTFKNLSEISLGDSILEVTELGRNFFGTINNRIRWVANNDFDKKKDKGKDKDDDMGNVMVKKIFKGHSYQLTMHLPCKVTKATAAGLGDIKDPKPVIESAWDNTSKVTWTVPLSNVLAAKKSAPPAFVVECYSWSGIKPGKTMSKAEAKAKKAKAEKAKK